MKYLKSYNESLTSDSSKELKENIELNLEDNEYFDTIDVYINKATWGHNETRYMIIIDEDFHESKNQEVIDLLKKVDDVHKYLQKIPYDFLLQVAEKRYHINDYERYEKELREEYHILVMNINNRLFEKIGKKYDFDVQTVEHKRWRTDDNSIVLNDRVTIVIFPLKVNESMHPEEDVKLRDSLFYDLEGSPNFTIEELDMKDNFTETFEPTDIAHKHILWYKFRAVATFDKNTIMSAMCDKLSKIHTGLDIKGEFWDKKFSNLRAYDSDIHAANIKNEASIILNTIACNILEKEIGRIARKYDFELYLNGISYAALCYDADDNQQYWFNINPGIYLQSGFIELEDSYEFRFMFHLKRPSDFFRITQNTF